MSKLKGGFTLPGEAGYEALTLKMADKWGADVIRDSDGTVLSSEILNSGYGIYSTICIIRDHNEWAKAHPQQLQQTFLMTDPELASSDVLEVEIMKGFFREQFQVNNTEAAMKYWQVYDRTVNEEVPREKWSYDEKREVVTISGIQPFHMYTVSFLAYRIWEEISMYNHTTNNWDKEHLMQVDPRYPETREYLVNWMEEWCKSHPDTTVVRFTSLFYNFVWIWGADERKRNLFTDWGSYDFTVSDKALDDFAKEYGYSMTAEDFVNKGDRHVTHMPADQRKRDWMKFINSFVIEVAKELIDITHKYGKKAYVFYDDSWVGLEPYGERFKEFGFDGLIKCVFNGYEVRLCAGVPVETHEIRLHPYLFPVGLGGAPTFMEGGNPTLDAKKYWNNVRRALLRQPIQRIGLGGYLHLTEMFPDFQDYIEKISDEFRMMQEYHKAGKPYTIKPKVAVLHYWGKLRSWTLSGHFHETYMHDLIHVNEALAGLPVDVDFINFEDVKAGALEKYDIVINAGRAGSAWSGGDAWKDDEVVSRLYQWVYDGGAFIGINQPSAVEGYDSFYRMAPVLGVDEDTGAKVCHGKWQFDVEEDKDILTEGAFVPEKENRFLTDGKAKVLAAHDGNPDLTIHEFGKGYGVYMGGFSYTLENTRMLLNLLLAVGDKDSEGLYLTDNQYTECAYYPESHKLVVINNSDKEQKTSVKTEAGVKEFTIEAYDQAVMDL
ncbi:1,3-beta-galactosyl-N-acetylhexosamine phosphorylase [bacterium 210702-DFI.5.13]|nr:1,3-beta-galactosyl-N-acetylhexosamine phosphorylase [bacterium 210702-DFI.5.13]